MDMEHAAFMEEVRRYHCEIITIVKVKTVMEGSGVFYFILHVELEVPSCVYARTCTGVFFFLIFF